MLKASVKNLRVVFLFLIALIIGAMTEVNSDLSLAPAPQDHQVSQQLRLGQLQVRLFDSVTGYGIQPKDLDEVTLKSDLREYKTQKAEKNNTVFLQAEQGIYDLAVTVRGYQPIATKVNIEEVGTPVEVLLDPVETPVEMREEYLSSLLRPDSGTVVGYVVDATTGLPLAKTTVGLKEGATKARTNRRGFFTLQIPMNPSDSDEDMIVKNIVFSLPGYITEERQHVQAFRNQVIVYRIRLTPGEGRNVIDEREHRNNAAASLDGESPQKNSVSQAEDDYADATQKPLPEESDAIVHPTAVTVPTTIRVGTNCTGRSCTGVTVMSLSNYCKRSLPGEWRAAWEMDSLKAGAVAVRSYAAWYVNNPISPNYDICSTTHCQSFGDTTNSRTNTAVDQTAGVVLADGNNRIAQSEYSRENNNKTCGDCRTGRCVEDTVCCGDFHPGSHGRGMCQQGSQRWASGTKYSPSGPVSSGNQPQNWIWILNHYYPGLRLEGVPGDFSITTTPITQRITRGANATCRVDIQSLNGFSGRVSLSALNLPPRYAGAFWTPAESVTVPSNGTVSSTLVVFTNSSTSAGTFTITIKAASGSLVKQKFLQWTITGADSRDQQAQQDMHNRASRDSRFLSPAPETFGKDLNWTSDFELRWMAFYFTRGRTVIMYHARAKGGGNRFITFYDPDTGRWTDWQQVF